MLTIFLVVTIIVAVVVGAVVSNALFARHGWFPHQWPNGHVLTYVGWGLAFYDILSCAALLYLWATGRLEGLGLFENDRRRRRQADIRDGRNVEMALRRMGML